MPVIRGTRACSLHDAFTASRPHLVLHLTARTDVRASMTATQDDASVNVLGSINVFGASPRWVCGAW